MTDQINNAAAGQLRAFVERIERLNEEKAAIGEDLREVYAEAAGTGFDRKALREVIAKRKIDHNARLAHEAIVDTYLHSLGLL